MHLKNLAWVWRVIGGALLLPWYLKHVPVVCWGWLALAQKAGPAHFFPVLYSVTSCWQLKIGCDGSVHAAEISKSYKSNQMGSFPYWGAGGNQSRGPF